MIEKEVLRVGYLKMRAQISAERRLEASKLLLENLRDRLEKASKVLSFISFNSEIDLSLVNDWLLGSGKLYIPRVEDNLMKIYRITDPLTQLQKSPNRGFMEPNPALTEEETRVDLVLPYHRIGYGQGHFDRFLKQYPLVEKIGVGFKEQECSEPFNFEEHDIALDSLCLV